VPGQALERMETCNSKKVSLQLDVPTSIDENKIYRD